MSEARARVLAARDLVEATRAAKIGLAYEGQPLVIMTSDGRHFAIGDVHLSKYSHNVNTAARLHTAVMTEAEIVGPMVDHDTERLVRLVARTSKLRLGKRGSKRGAKK